MTRLALLLPLALLAGCKEDAPKPKTAPTAVAKAEPAPSGGGGNTNYVAGGGAVQNTRQAAKRTVALADMSQLGVSITALADTIGKMPTAQEIQADLKSTPTLLKLITDGTVILTGTQSRSGLWAYELDADTKGGIGLVGGTASRYQADEIKNLKQGG